MSVVSYLKESLKKNWQRTERRTERRTEEVLRVGIVHILVNPWILFLVIGELLRNRRWKLSIKLKLGR